MEFEAFDFRKRGNEKATKFVGEIQEVWEVLAEKQQEERKGMQDGNTIERNETTWNSRGGTNYGGLASAKAIMIMMIGLKEEAGVWL